MTKLTHIDEKGAARMVDVGGKAVTARSATAEAVVRLSPAAFSALRDGTLRKGDAIAVARIAAIGGAKRTSDLIPLCHPLALTGVDVDIELNEAGHSCRIVATARVEARTGVEMEALTAATVGALAIYDMCKAIDRGIVVERIRLLAKSGGASGAWSVTDVITGGG